jgi:hypothetical protein
VQHESSPAGASEPRYQLDIRSCAVLAALALLLLLAMISVPRAYATRNPESAVPIVAALVQGLAGNVRLLSLTKDVS